MALGLKRVIKFARRIDDAYCVASGKGFRLKDYDPGDTGKLGKEDKPRAREALKLGVARRMLLGE